MSVVMRPAVRPPVRALGHGRHMTPRSTSAPHPHRSTRRSLSREWARLSTRPTSLRTAAAWRITPRPTSLDEVVEAIGGNDRRSDAADERLRRLVALARRDDLAARVVIERLVPGLLALARKYPDRPDAFEELLAAAWIAVRTYNSERTPANIAVALLSDAEYGAYRKAFRRREYVDRPAQLPDDLPADDGPHPSQELAELLAEARQAGVRPDDLDLVRRLVATPNTEELARDLAVTSRTIRNRRERAVASLRQLALAG